MAVFACYIQKKMHFAGTMDNHFGNTYHFTDEMGVLDPATLVNQVADIERALLGVDVDFVKGVVWGPTDGPIADNIIQDEIQLSGTGDVAAMDVYKEICPVFRWDLPRSETTNRRRWLRKYLRGVGAMTSLTTEMKEGREPLSDSLKQSLIDLYADPMKRLAFNDDFVLCTADGTENTGTAYVSDFLRTRRLDKSGGK